MSWFDWPWMSVFIKKKPTKARILKVIYVFIIILFCIAIKFNHIGSFAMRITVIILSLNKQFVRIFYLRILWEILGTLRALERERRLPRLFTLSVYYIDNYLLTKRIILWKPTESILRLYGFTVPFNPRVKLKVFRCYTLLLK